MIVRGSDSGGARYTSVAIWLHWTIAALVLLNLGLGFFHDDLEGISEALLMFFHKAIGVTVIGLTLLRLLWRLGHKPPIADPVMSRWEAGLAGLVHWLFYLLLIAVPLAGWMLSSTNGRSVDYFGLFDMGPLPVPRGDEAHDLFEDLHENLAKAMLVLIGLHVAGALKHHLQGHRQVMGRMAPWLLRSR